MNSYNKQEGNPPFFTHMIQISLLLTPREYDGEMLTITGEKYHHLAHVRRISVGAALRAALPDGRVLCAEVIDVTADSVRARVTGEEAPGGVSPCQIILYQAILKGEKMDLVTQKATELGVAMLAPVSAQRSVPRWTRAQAVERSRRWQRIADAAAEQCERSMTMQILPTRPLAETLVDEGMKFVLHEREGETMPALAARFPVLTAIGLYIGPEGGWDTREMEMFQAAAVPSLHLGGRILRAETAAIAVVTLTQYLWGDLSAGA